MECLNCGSLDAVLQCENRRYCSKECALQKEREEHSMEINLALKGLETAVKYSRAAVQKIEIGDVAVKPGCSESLAASIQLHKKLVKVQSMIIRMFGLLLARNQLYFRFKSKFQEESCELLAESPSDHFALEMGKMMTFVYDLSKKDVYFLTAI